MSTPLTEQETPTTEPEPPLLTTHPKSFNLTVLDLSYVDTVNDENIEVLSDNLTINSNTIKFLETHFPTTTTVQWNNWQWQLKNRIRTLQQLNKIIDLTEDELDTIQKLGNHLPIGITPYYASLMQNQVNDPFRQMMIPTTQELIQTEGEYSDPLAEDTCSPVEGLVHRYPDRVLFLITSFCATYCRYCTRSRLVGQTGEYHFNTQQQENVLNYIRNHTEIRDVLLSGGDPLTMTDRKIDWLLTELRKIKHVQFIRIGTKIPAVLPQRITHNLTQILKQHKIWLSIHFMHPNEVTDEVTEACEKLADAGIPLGSQTVLLKNVNDNVNTMKELMHKLLMIRVRPYYLYQCDPISGSKHFRTSVETGLKIIEGLRGHTTGYAIPHFVIDAPGGGGKIPLLPEYVVGRKNNELILRNYENKEFTYFDPL